MPIKYALCKKLFTNLFIDYYIKNLIKYVG